MQVSVPSIFTSKKFIAAALASVVSLAGMKYGLTLEQIGLATAPLYTFIAAQGVADIGKERAKAEAASKMPPQAGA